MNIIVKGLGKRRGKKVAEQIQEMVLRRSFRWSQRVNVSFGYSFSERPSIEFKDIEDRDIYKVRTLISRLKDEIGILEKISTMNSVTCPAVPVKIPRDAHSRKPLNPIAEFFEML